MNSTGTGGESLPTELTDALASLAPGDEASLAALCAQHPEWAERLRAVAGEVSRLDSSSAAAAADDELTVVDQIGPYRLLRRIDSGGMGTVWQAQREHPVQQRVAIKVIKLGMDTEAIVARFQQERQLLAHMEHDGIAKVFDCGATTRGRPWFAMEYVEGEPITAYCDRRRLSIPARLQILQQVCAAVTHAHQKSVIHRDLKPGNVLVGERDGRPFVKVIDFGLAKALAPSTGATAHPATAGPVGTLEYMAPEQADPRVADIDTRADVYALGVILQELLIGERPVSVPARQFDSAQLAALLAEAVVEPPSQRFAGLAEATAAARAVARDTSVAGLRSALARDLDWVVLKATARQREDRYSTPGALADELQRFLGHEPLSVGPPSTLHRLRKFTRRYRYQVVVVAAVLMTALVGAVVALDQAAVARANLAARQQQILLGDLATLRHEADESLWWEHGAGPTEAALLDWLRRAELIREPMQDWRTQRENLLARALPMTAEDERQRRDRMAASGVMEAARARLAATPEVPAAAAARAFLVRRLDVLERQFERLRVVRFSTEADATTWQQVDRIVREGDDFFGDQAMPGWFASVQDRLAIVKRLAATEAERMRRFDAVQGAVDAVAPGLGDLLRATPGLVPLGADPDSGLLEFCLATTGEVPERDAAGRLKCEERHGLVFVLVPGGSAAIGAQREAGLNHDPDAEVDEQPVVHLNLAPYLLGKFELNQAIWLRMTGANPAFYAPTPRSDNPITAMHPVESVSVATAERWLRRFGMQLPTEAQWEFAARCGTDTPRFVPDHKLSAHLNVADQAAKRVGFPWREPESWDDEFAMHAPVTSMLGNRFGFHHMLGNVWEWCADIYEIAYPKGWVPRHGDGRRTGDIQLRRVARGGSFQQPRVESRASNRGAFPGDTVMDHIGVRPLLTVRL